MGNREGHANTDISPLIQLPTSDYGWPLRTQPRPQERMGAVHSISREPGDAEGCASLPVVALRARRLRR
jgi:hypothetical protein